LTRLWLLHAVLVLPVAVLTYVGSPATLLSVAYQDPCAVPPPIKKEELPKYAGRWIEISPFGCTGDDLPPPGSEVVLYLSRPATGRPLATVGVLAPGGAWDTDRGRLSFSAATHWMFVGEPGPRGSSFNRYREGRW
jgi:hypothetical protein